MKRLVKFTCMVAVSLGGVACIYAESTAPAPSVRIVAPAADFDKGVAVGFQVAEAQDMVDLCIDLNEPQGKASIAGWELQFDGSHEQAKKGIGPYDNAWKLWKKRGEDNTYAIVIRGTIEDWNSIKADLLATSVDANRAEINLGEGKVLPVVLASTGKAETHLGFSYSMAVLMFHKDMGILKKLKELVPAGSKIFITGHSQGAAIATLTHSFLYYAMRDPASRYGLPGYGLKSYFFAQPKPGNWQYGMDFAKIAGNRGLAYVINNVLDWVPQVPIAIEFLDEPLADLSDEYMKDLPVAKRMLIEASINGMQKVRKQVAEQVKARVEGKIRGYSSSLDAQYIHAKQGAEKEPTANSINYVSVGNLISISGEGDSSIVHDGVFTQHHATNYKKLLKTLEH